MSDDWKWVLRSSTSTRPILRMLEERQTKEITQHASLFSNTQGVVKLSAGDSSVMPALGGQPDLGTAFAVATSFMGANRVELSGNLGYASQSGLPSAGFRTSYSRRNEAGSSPELSLTMRQVFLPARAGAGLMSGQDNLPTLRTMSLAMSDRSKLTDNLTVHYGFTLDSVSFIQRLNYVSPFARFSFDSGEMGVIEFAYSSGLPPVDLISENSRPTETERQHEVATLGLFPRVSLRNGLTEVQRVTNFEIGYRRMVGSRTYSVGAYREAVSNAAVNALGGVVDLDHDVLPDLFGGGSILNIGRYSSLGYVASVTQAFGDHWGLTLAYGNGGALQTTRRELTTGDPDELRRLIRAERRHYVTGRVSGTMPLSDTRFTASYQFSDSRALTPGHFFLTQRTNPEPGLNVSVRQPIPAFSGLPGKLEASAELRNLLAQGYLPLTTSQNRRLQLIHSPRAFRGGLAFIF
jgi:hypothetical protein